MCRGSTLTADGRLFASVRNEGGITGAIDLGEDLDRSQFEDTQPDSWKRGQALLSLCQCMEYDKAEALLRDEGVDPDAAYEDGTTGLHMAAYNDAVEWASLCVSPPSFIYFPILIGEPKIVLRYGANKHRKNGSGATPLDCARDVKAQGVIDLLEQM
jgi:ankyrin repeat protein